MIALTVLAGVSFGAARYDDPAHVFHRPTTADLMADVAEHVRPFTAPHAAPYAVPRAAAQPALPSPRTIAHFPLVAASADLRADDIVREPAIPEDWTADADFVLGGPAMAIDVEGDIAYVGIGAHLVALDVSGDGESVTLGASPPLPGLVKDVEVRDGIAYAAVSQTRLVPEDPGGLFVIDVSEPADLRVVGVTPIVGGAMDVAVDGDWALVASADNWFDWLGGPRFIGLTLVDIGDPTSLRRIRRWPIAEAFWEADVEIKGSVGYVCYGELSVLDLERDAPPRIVEPRVPCTEIERFDDGAWMVAIADERVTHRETLRMLSLSRPESPSIVAEIRLHGEDDGLPEGVRVGDIALDDSDSDVIYMTGWHREDGGFVGRFDLGGLPAVDRSWTALDDVIGFGVSMSGGRAIVAGGVHVSGLWPASELLDVDLEHILGSAVVVVPSVPEDGAAPIVARTGPGTVSALVASAERAYVLETVGGGALWGFDLSTRYPTALGLAKLESEFSFPNKFNGSWTAISDGGVFIVGEEMIHNLDIRDGAPVVGGGIPLTGIVAAEGDTLFIATYDGRLQSFDVSEPLTPSLLASIDLPSNSWISVAVDEGRLWLVSAEELDSVETVDSEDRSISAAVPSRASAHLLIDVRDPSAPRVQGPFPSLLGEDVHINDREVWRVQAEGDLAHVLAFDWSEQRLELITLVAPADGGPPVFVKRTAAELPFEYPHAISVFASTRWQERQWLATLPWYDHFERFALVAVNFKGSAATAPGTMYSPATASRARHTTYLDEGFHYSRAVKFAVGGDRMLVSHDEGGLMGFSSEPREATWSFDGDEALDGEGHGDWRGEGRTDDRRFDRPSDLTGASPPEPPAGRSDAVINIPDTAAAAPQLAVVQERPVVPIFLPAAYADAGVPTDPSTREPAIPSVWTPDADWVLGGPAMAVDVSGDVGFYGVGAHLVAMDLSGDGAPEPIGYSPPLPGQVSDVVVREGVAFVTVAQIRALDGMPGGLFTLDVSDPTAPRVLGIGPINGGANALAVDGDRALVISATPEWESSTAQRRFQGLSLYDVSDPSSPRRVASWPSRNLFSSSVSDAVIFGGLAFVCRFELFVLDLESDAYPIKVSPTTPCSHVTIDRDRERLVVVDERITTFALDEFLGVGDILVLEEVGRSPLFDPELDLPRNPRILAADLEDGRLLVGGALGGSDKRGFLQLVEIAGVEPVDRRLTFIEDDVPFGVALHDDLALTAGARKWNRRSTDVEEMIDEGALHTLGSAAAIYHESSPGELGRRGAVVGPSTVVVRSLAHEGRLHLIDMSPNVFDIDPSSDRKNATFWSFDVTGPFPRLIGSSPIRYPFGPQADLLTQAASSRALFFSEADSLPNTLVVDISDGVPREVGRLPVGGRIAASGDVLYVLTGANVLEVYDVRDPSAPVLAIPIRLESLGLPNFIHVTAFAASDELLWLGMQPDFHGATTVSRARAASAEHSASRPWLAVLDIRNPLRPRLAGSLESEESSPTSHTNVIDLLTLGDRAIALGIAIDPLPAEGEIPFIERAISIVAHPAPESRSPPSPAIIARAISIVAHGAGERLEVEDVVDFPAPSERRFIWPFTMAATGGRLWFGSPGYPVIVEDAEEFGLIEVALDETMPMEIVGAYRLPASMLARLSDGLAWLQHEVVEGLQLDSLGDRLLVARMEGGVAAIDTRIEPPRWIPPPTRERTGPASTSALILRNRQRSPSDRAVAR